MMKLAGKERMMITLMGGIPDRVPVAPDISTMIPIRLSGKKYNEVEIEQNPPLWQAYIRAARHFGIDGWNICGALEYQVNNPQMEIQSTVTKEKGRWRVEHTVKTPAGDLHQVGLAPDDSSFAYIERMVKNFKEDFPKLKYLLAAPDSYDDQLYKRQKKAMGNLGILANSIVTPGMNVFFMYFSNGLEDVTYAYYDEPDLFMELVDLYDRLSVRQTELAIDAGVESILTGGSGSITMQSPEIWRKISLPTLKKISKMCHEAGVLCGVHSCGKEMELVRGLVEETHIDYVNPLEIPLMGDCFLAECKRLFGGRIALMGNLHTTDIMLFGSVEDVRRESLKAIRDAGQDGGFVLSTGDQCGYATPDENIFEMVRVAEEFGHYPLDMDRIQTEIDRLEKKSVKR